jgi:hypothetical protein
MKIIESASRKQGSEMFYKFESGHTAVWTKSFIYIFLPNGHIVSPRMKLLKNAVKQAIFNNFR